MKQKIVTDKAFLSKKCELVNKDEDISQLIQDLEDTLVTKKGYALCANQIGIQKQVSIIRSGQWKLDIINPTVVLKEDKVMFNQEGCLSFPGIRFNTDRYSTFVFESGFDRQRHFYYGLEAIICEHEIDHLFGITFFTRKHKARK